MEQAVRVITTRDGSLETPESIETLQVVNGEIQAAPERGTNKICMIDPSGRGPEADFENLSRA